MRATCSGSGSPFAAERSNPQLGRHDRELERAIRAQDLKRGRLADPLADHQALQVVDALDALAVDGDDQVLGP